MGEPVPDFSGSGGIPWPTIFGIITALGAVAHFMVPLTSSRPVAPQGQSSIVNSYQDLDARLWQDPLQVVQTELDRAQKAGADAASPEFRDFECLHHQIVQEKIAPRVLAVMLSGLPYGEATESRLRERLALVSGLGRARYVPDDGEHLGFITVNWPRPEIPDRPFELSLKKIASQRVTRPPNVRLQFAWRTGQIDFSESAKATPPDTAGSKLNTLSIPYEWWHQQCWRDSSATDAATGDGKKTSQRVLVLWLREDSFQDSPLRRLASLLGPILDCWKNREGWAPEPDITVIGPTQSATLRTMLFEADDKIPQGFKSALCETKLLSPLATGSDELLRYPLSERMRNGATTKPSNCGPADHSQMQPTDVSELLVAYGGLKSCRRMIATDDVLARALLNELHLRRIDLGSKITPRCHIAIVSEWDTVYGRSLPITFTAEAVGGAHAATRLLDSPNSWPCWIHRFSYLRGIDGKLPGDQKSTETPSESTPASTSTWPDLSKTLIPPRPAEVTEGRDQSDALRRLSEELVQLNSDCSGDGGLKAVGVLGSDVYDKLEILKAFRTKLPDALFFTTELDARYWSASDLQETKNLVIASPFGLQLSRDDRAHKIRATSLASPSDGLQGDIPPFRDDLQTSVFFTTLYALGQIKFSDQDLSRSLASPRVYEIGSDGPVDLSQEHLGEWIHPKWLDHREHPISWIQTMLILVGCFIPYYFLCTRNSLPLTPWNWFPGAAATIAAFIIAGALLVVLIYLGSGREGEPFVFLKGVSIWGTEAIRAFALGCSVALMIYSHFRLQKNAAEITLRFDLITVERRPIRYLSWRAVRCRINRAWNGVIRWKPDDGNCVDSPRLWRHYRIYDSTGNRFLRIAIHVAAAAFCVATILSIAGQSNFSPARGETAYWVDHVVTVLAVLAMVTLVFYVGDAARLCKKLASNLGAGRTRWRTAPLRRYAEIYRLKHRDIGVFLDVALLAQRTEAIMPLVYYPYVVIFLMIAARSPYFAGWHWPGSVLAILSTLLLITVYDYLTLRQAAERVRADSVQALQDTMLSLPRGDDRRDRLQTLKEVIQNTNSGAFALFSRNPIVGAVLLPCAGLGAWALFRLFTG